MEEGACCHSGGQRARVLHGHAADLVPKSPASVRRMLLHAEAVSLIPGQSVPFLSFLPLATSRKGLVPKGQTSSCSCGVVRPSPGAERGCVSRPGAAAGGQCWLGAARRAHRHQRTPRCPRPLHRPRPSPAPRYGRMQQGMLNRPEALTEVFKKKNKKMYTTLQTSCWSSK